MTTTTAPAEEDVIVLVKSFRGIIARWAVQQSPYPTGPAQLGQVLATVTERFKAFKGKEKCLGTTFIRLPRERKLVQRFVKIVLEMPEVQAWNRRANGRDGIGITSAYDNEDGCDPNDDFIDLDALVQNIASSLMERS
jgi:hypothetical protein